MTETTLQIEYGQTGSMAGTPVVETALTDLTMWSKAAVANSVVRPKRLQQIRSCVRNGFCRFGLVSETSVADTDGSVAETFIADTAVWPKHRLLDRAGQNACRLLNRADQNVCNRYCSVVEMSEAEWQCGHMAKRLNEFKKKILVQN